MRTSAKPLGNFFIENYEKAFRPNAIAIADKQLLPIKAHCKFLHYIENKPNKKSKIRKF